ncbi:MAG: hypothetical protein WC152_08380 [Candidatus Izemoplasmatales bacterium]
MKRIFFSIITLYIVIGIILIIVIKPKNVNVNFFTIKQNYSRLMTENESLVFGFFIDQNSSFITDKDNIVNASLTNNINKIAVNISNIEQIAENIEYKEKLYYQYNLTIDFSEIYVNEFELNLVDAFLELSYINGDTLSLALGDIFLSFGDIECNNYLDYSNIYGLVNNINDELYLTALIIKFENLSDKEIIINQITTNNNMIEFDLENYQKSIEKYEFSMALEDIITDYNYIGEAKEGSILLEDEFYYIFPIKYKEDLKKIYRFPLQINFYYNEENHLISLDDYLFFDEQIILDDYVNEITEYQYSYQ